MALQTRRPTLTDILMNLEEVMCGCGGGVGACRLGQGRL
jgi:hypothetical protein